MSDRITVASCSFFGIRHDRDATGYYRTAINDFARKTDLEVVLFSNDPSKFECNIDVRLFTDVDAQRRRIFADTEWPQSYLDRLGWHPKNRTLDQYNNRVLCSVYAAKMQFLLDIVHEKGDVFWLDSGLLYSYVYDHNPPDKMPGYSAERIRDRLLPYLRERQACREAAFFLFPSRRQWWKAYRPTFHGVTYMDMLRASKAVGARPDPWYVSAACMFIPAARADEIERTFKKVWQAIWDGGHVGTEENVLSIVRWLYRFPGVDERGWVQLLADPQGDYAGETF